MVQMGDMLLKLLFVFHGRQLMEVCIFAVLKINQAADGGRNFQHPPDTLGFPPGDVLLIHPGIFTVIEFVIHQSIAEIAHLGVGGDRFRQHFFFILVFRGGFGVFAVQIGNSALQPFVQVLSGDWVAGGGLFVAEHGLVKYHFAQHHFWVVNKIAVHRDTVCVLLHRKPRAVFFIRHDFPFPLFQIQNIRGGFCSGHLLEGVIRQAHRTD